MRKLLNKRATGTRTSRGLMLASGRASGFTLVEMLVAVGAVAFVAVGIASIFASVGDTVSRGRSVSALTQYAAVLERQMREDFAAMTRDGFMLIRHEEASGVGGNGVPLYADQPSSQWRSRRIDEIMFFANKTSRSAREPLAPGFVPEGSSARIYYGIGQRMDPNDARYANPDVVDTNRTGQLLGLDGVNRVANTWTLLRHETALVSPGGGAVDSPGATYPAGVWQDNRLQIGMQPAAESIFRSINELNVSSCTDDFPSVQTVRDSFGVSSADPDRSPLFESGLVDVATTNLAEIRGIVMSSAGFQDADSDPYRLTPPYAFISPAGLNDCMDYYGPGPVVGPVGLQQAWMLDALPAPSHSVEISFTGGTFPIGSEVPGTQFQFPSVGPSQRSRIRYEPAPPDMHTPLADSVTSATRGAIRLADQYALSSSAFIPRTTEFIVEWSFGKLDDEGRLIWHGADRMYDGDGDGTEELLVQPYPRYAEEVRGTRAELAGSYFVPYRLARPASAGDAGVGNQAREFTNLPRLGTDWHNDLAGNFAAAGDEYASYPVLPEVVHGVRGSSLGGATSSAPLVSYFGYTLPFFNPADPDRDGNLADESAQDTLEWPWPELVRVTVTLADPGDETIERTFQFVFPTPENPVR
ncbi:MAG: hypothetical protein ACIAQU_04035 [Phycisphaerales bacterium JB064]